MHRGSRSYRYRANMRSRSRSEAAPGIHIWAAIIWRGQRKNTRARNQVRLPVVYFSRQCEVVVSNAEIQRQAMRDAIIVLHVEAVHVTAHIGVRVHQALLDLRRKPEQETCERCSARRLRP